MNQVELEQEMIDGGRNRAKKMFENNAEAGNAAANPYASAIFRRYVLPLAAVIEQDMTAKAAGRRQAHVQLLAGMDYEAVAFIAVRGVLNSLLQDSEGGRALTTNIGRAVYNEFCLQHFSDMNPELYFTLANEFDRKLTKSERHRMTVFQMQAKKNGIEFAVWGQAGITQVGGYLVECLDALGMVNTSMDAVSRGRSVTHVLNASLTPSTRALLDGIQEHVMEATPEVMPCVEPPKDWTSISDGGWHTDGMRRVQPFCVRAGSDQREHFRNNDMSHELRALNKLQSVAWRINEKMLDTIRKVAQHFDMEEIVSQAEFPAPTKPVWLALGIKKEDMTEYQLAEFTQWKREAAEWHTQMKLRGTKWGRFYTATRMADKFRHENAIYFVYFIDFRGRKYAKTTGVSPQGSDLQKALLEFSKGKPLLTPKAKEFFLITGANRFGVDKVSIEQRVRWVAENHDQIMQFAQDPIAFNAWREADKPFQFLAWCFEYATWNVLGDAFQSRVAVGMDGSCNGLQNYSAMLRDEVGGAATNLIPSELPNDIYAQVAVVVSRLLETASNDEFGFRQLWIKHGMNRKLVKRSVMTLPYGSTRFSCADFIVDDYMKMGLATEFSKEQYSKAATFLSHLVWQAIGEVVIKAREAMDWLQESAKILIKLGMVNISWYTPSGFPAIQTYWEEEVHRINTRLCGGTKLSFPRETDVPDLNRHRNGIAPNFIHGCDAAHLTLTVCEADTVGIDALAMIHDDYGTHAADAEKLSEIIRSVFIGMYRDANPLQELYERYPQLNPPPGIGTLDLEVVKDSKYFFL